MGELIDLAARREARRQRTAQRPERTRAQFFFDLSCPFSYLAAERIERAFDDVVWTPASAPGLRRADVEAVRHAAEERADALRLPLVWPERFPAAVPAAMRVAALAADRGRGAAYVLAATRLAFCGGFDLDDPELLAEAAGAAGLGFEDCVDAAGDAAATGDRARRPGPARRGRRPAAGAADRSRAVLGRATGRRTRDGARALRADVGSARAFAGMSPPRASPRVGAGLGGDEPGEDLRVERVDRLGLAHVAHLEGGQHHGVLLLLLGEEEIELGERRVHVPGHLGCVHDRNLGAAAAAARGPSAPHPRIGGVCSPAMTTESHEATAFHGGRLIARRLKAHGVRKLFTLSGGHLFSIYDGCRTEGIDLVDVRHESAAAFAAEGWAKVTREPGVCALTAGPG